MATTLATEKAYKWRGKVGLLNVSDYVLATTNENCTTGVKGHSDTSSCYNTNTTDNWLHKDIMINANYPWLISPYVAAYEMPDGIRASSNYNQMVDSSGAINVYNSYVSSASAVPVFYVKSDIKLTGTGTSSNPFVVIQ